MATNNFMVGVAFQAGTIPLKAESIEAAIKQSGVAVEMSLAAFRWGRMAVVDRAFVEAEIAKGKAAVSELPQMSPAARAIVDSVGAQGETKRLLEVRVPDLIDYQDEAYARRYADVVKRVVAAEQKAVPGKERARGGGRALSVQADGVQGRVRSRAAALRPRLPGASSTRSSSTATRSSTTSRRR